MITTLAFNELSKLIHYIPLKSSDASKYFLNYIVQHIRLATALNDELVVSVSRFRSSLVFF